MLSSSRLGQTELARDLAFGYTASDLRDFVAQKGRWGDRTRRGRQHQPGRHQAGRAVPGPWSAGRSAGRDMGRRQRHW